MGFKGVNGVVDMIRNGAKPKSEDTGSTVVTKENLNSDEVQAVLKPSCDNPPT